MKLNSLILTAVCLWAVPSCVSTQTSTPPAPPVVKTRPVTSYPKPKPKRVSQPAEETVEATPNPLEPDPLKVIEKPEIPKFEVPENIQPKVSDGIDQSEFIELKWTVFQH